MEREGEKSIFVCFGTARRSERREEKGGGKPRGGETDVFIRLHARLEV